MAFGPLFHSNVPVAPGIQMHLERRRVDALLERAMQSPVLKVIAGAGYGKTHAVYSFVRQRKVHTAWIQLSERDNMGERFWENFVSAIASINQKSARKLAELGFPATEQQFERYLQIPQADIIPHEEYIFVYDDVHLLTDRAVLRYLEHSIAVQFPNISSILIARTEPALDMKALTETGKVARITETDLRFTQDEMTAYFRLLNLSPSQETVSSLYQETEGWAFAIHLAALSLRNAGAGADQVPHALKSNCFKLIESEVMAPLSEELRRFLIKLSLIDQATPELIEEIEGRTLITEIERIGSFIRFDSYLNAYRIHHLFLNYLRGQQGVIGEDEKKTVWAKAGAWCAAHNRKLDAINYYEKAGDYGALLDVVYTMPLILPNSTARMLLEILNRAPAEIFERIPQAPITHIRLYIHLGLFDKAVEELQRIIMRVEPAVTACDHRVLAGCYNNLAYVGLATSTYTRDYSYAVHFERAWEHSKLSNYQIKPPVSVFGISSHICRVNSPERGEMERYIAALEKAVPYMTRALSGSASGLDDLAWGELALFRGELAAAEGKLREAIRKARERDQYEIEHRALFYLLRIKVYRGAFGEISPILDQLKAQLDLPYYINRYTYYDIAMGWFYLQIERWDKIAPWLRSDYEESDLNPLVHGLEILVKAKYHLREKQYPSALAVLENRRGKYGIWAFAMGKVEILCLEAVCRYRLHDQQGAYRALRSAWEQAEPNGFTLPLVELGRDMRTLTSGALKAGAGFEGSLGLEQIHRDAAAYAKKLTALTEHFGAQVPGADAQAEGTAVHRDLSPREYAVLTGLSQGLTREEIARFSTISINTVKSTVRSIYNKLGAMNQADAVRIATERGILS